ncbi:hypothetical protein ACIRVK_13550 [Streptomyces sp. NPDC101152]|uniref:hypothetical protein n=1 Tax=Streptomyces sp. NPDC101152 TaxID=3366116 RepID=UPI0038130D42
MAESSIRQAPTSPVGALPGPVANLLAAIHAALDVPLADRPADDRQRADLLTRRAADTKVLLELCLVHGDLTRTAMRLREWTAQNPVLYPTWQARAEQAAAEEQALLDEGEKGTAICRTPGGDQRCPAAHPNDPTPCGGPVVVTVLDRTNAGADGCEHHAARLLASLEGGRVYGLPDAPEGSAIHVFRAADGIRPFPWVPGPRTRDEQLSRAENRRGGEDR